MHTRARSDRIDDHKTDDESNRRNRFEVKQREAARFADLLHVFHAGNTRHNGTEDHGGNDHFDETNKAVAERLHRSSDVGSRHAEPDTDQDRANDLEIKNFVDGSALCGLACHCVAL